jgi:hypothetical protein
MDVNNLIPLTLPRMIAISYSNYMEPLVILRYYARKHSNIILQLCICFYH